MSTDAKRLLRGGRYDRYMSNKPEWSRVPFAVHIKPQIA